MEKHQDISILLPVVKGYFNPVIERSPCLIKKSIIS
jgi:hypothetical protein